jgi:hypothetical protein
MSLESIRELRENISSGKIPRHKARGYIDSLAARMLQNRYRESREALQEAAQLIGRFKGYEPHARALRLYSIRVINDEDLFKPTEHITGSGLVLPSLALTTEKLSQLAASDDVGVQRRLEAELKDTFRSVYFALDVAKQYGLQHPDLPNMVVLDSMLSVLRDKGTMHLSEAKEMAERVYQPLEQTVNLLNITYASRDTG